VRIVTSNQPVLGLKHQPTRQKHILPQSQAVEGSTLSDVLVFDFEPIDIAGFHCQHLQLDTDTGYWSGLMPSFLVHQKNERFKALQL
jgi:hypothetical protein